MHIRTPALPHPGRLPSHPGKSKLPAGCNRGYSAWSGCRQTIPPDTSDAPAIPLPADETNYNRAQQVAKKLDSLLPQDINVSSYNNMNLYIASNALNNKPLLLKQAIISEIENIIQNNISQFIFEAVAYSTYEIGSNINITLPSSIPNNTISQISGIKISYYSYALTSSVNSKISDIFTITGFINAK